MASEVLQKNLTAKVIIIFWGSDCSGLRWSFSFHFSFIKRESQESRNISEGRFLIDSWFFEYLPLNHLSLLKVVFLKILVHMANYRRVVDGGGTLFWSSRYFEQVACLLWVFGTSCSCCSSISDCFFFGVLGVFLVLMVVAKKPISQHLAFILYGTSMNISADFFLISAYSSDS